MGFFFRVCVCVFGFFGGGGIKYLPIHIDDFPQGFLSKKKKRDAED